MVVVLINDDDAAHGGGPSWTRTSNTSFGEKRFTIETMDPYG